MSHRWCRELLIFGVLLSALSGMAFGSGDSPARSLSPLIHRVDVRGNWSRDGEFGRYRIIKMESMGEHGLSRIEVQWLANEPAESGGKVVGSRALDEEGLPMLSNICWTVYKATRNRLELRLSGRLPDGKPSAWRVTAARPGEITIVSRPVFKCSPVD